jgi:hypothetical protein
MAASVFPLVLLCLYAFRLSATMHTLWFGLYFFPFRLGERVPLTKILYLSVHFLALYVLIIYRTNSSSQVRRTVTVVDRV